MTAQTTPSDKMYQSPIEVAQSHTPIEAAQGIRFVNADRKREHTLKHPIRGRNERWHQVLDSQILDRARDEWAQEEIYGDACRALAAAYEDIIAEAIHAVCCTETGHGHVLEFDWILDDVPRPNPMFQTIYGWLTDKKLIFVAKLHVSTEDPSAYTIRTGYRGAPKQSKRHFVAQQHARLQERALLDRKQAIIALHDESNDL